LRSTGFLLCPPLPLPPMIILSFIKHCARKTNRVRLPDQ
jgi:hypothetical protein